MNDLILHAVACLFLTLTLRVPLRSAHLTLALVLFIGMYKEFVWDVKPQNIDMVGNMIGVGLGMIVNE
jgi:hypothetical protein